MSKITIVTVPTPKSFSDLYYGRISRMEYPIQLSTHSPRCFLCKELKLEGFKKHLMEKHPEIVVYHLMRLTENMIKNTDWKYMESLCHFTK